MTNPVVHRSVFDLCPSDELVEVQAALGTPCSQAPAGIGGLHDPGEATGLGHEQGRDLASSWAPPPSAALEDVREDVQQERWLSKEASNRMACSACRCTFTSREDQMEHYKLDWHRFNLKQKILGQSPVTAEEFEKKTREGEVSSISGSGSDSEDDNNSNVTATGDETSPRRDASTGRPSPKVVFQNSAGEYLLVHRCILRDIPAQSADVQDPVSSLKNINKKTLWAILMTGGGHFVGAIFQGKEVLQHKTFHRYTVRAKRGTAQGLKDSQNHSHAPKSAGAALRRHNEAALVKDIQDLLVSWSKHLKEASAIFIRAPSYNRGIFFGGRAAPLDKKDPRICSIPFATRRATFHEAQRVHEVLSSVHVYGKDTDMSAVFNPSKKAWKKPVKHAAQEKTDPDSVTAAEDHVMSEEEEGEIELKMSEVTLGTLDLREYEICPSRRQRRRTRKKEEKRERPNGADTREADGVKETPPGTRTETPVPADDSEEYGLRDLLFTACKVGDVDTLRQLLQPPMQRSGPREQSDSHSSTVSSPLPPLNEPLDSSGFTLLHVASAAAQKAAVRLLMDAGADPGCSDKKGQTPYIVAPDKDTRNVFRRYMGDNPDRYDYKKAQIPGPLTAAMESKRLDKKKAQKVAKKQRDKEEKGERKKEELEAEEKARFASLTDREKRALAAEKRLAKQVAATGVDISNVKRCWTCGESLLGKIPFQYWDYSFCTPRCVQAHRKANAPPGKA